MLLTKKYSPKSIDEMVGNDEARERIKKWMLNWLGGKKRRPLLVYGPPGVGKTSAAYALMREFDLELIEMNASELRNRERVEAVVKSAMLAGTLSGKGKIILIDDVDVFAGKKDSGGPAALAALLKEANCPVFLTATDAWDKKLAAIRSECELVEMKRVNKIAIRKLIERIIKSEGMNIEEADISRIIENANGDVRSALNDLQTGKTSLRDREKDIFTKMKTLFKASTWAEARSVAYGDVDFDVLKLWIDENIPNEYEDINDIAAAYYWLSRSDVFEGRIAKSSWVLLKYSIDLATTGVALSKRRSYNKFTKYSFPTYLREMSRAAQSRSIAKSIGTKVGRRTHTNAKEALEMLPIISLQMKNNLEGIITYYELNEDEVAFIISKESK